MRKDSTTMIASQVAAAVDAEIIKSAEDIAKMKPPLRDVLVADVMIAIAAKLLPRFGHESTIWGINAANERLRMVHDKQKRKTQLAAQKRLRTKEVTR